MIVGGENLALAQSIYMNYLINLTKQQVAEIPASVLTFDPQGRVLINVKLTEADFENILDQMEAANILGDWRKELHTTDFSVYKQYEQYLAQFIGFKVTPTTLVSLEDASFENEFLDRLGGTSRERKAHISKILRAIPRGSIIALQQELYFHLSLVKRVFAQLNGLDEESVAKLDRAYEEAIKEVNEQVLTVYRAALSATPFNLATLNRRLDAARPEIASCAHTILIDNITKVDLPFPPSVRRRLKYSLKLATATAQDILHVNTELKLATLIQSEIMTSHAYWLGDMPRRLIITHRYEEGKVLESHPRFRIRIPTPVIKKISNSPATTEAMFVEDATQKLSLVVSKYRLHERLSRESYLSPRNAIIYNQLTALNDTFGDLGGNSQTASARHILLAAHAYNRNFTREDDDKKQFVFCFVQGISVNGFGDALGYGFNRLRNEATLMAEMALLHTVYAAANQTDKARIDRVFLQYETFLYSSRRFFSSSSWGKDAIQTIQQLKNRWLVYPVDENDSWTMRQKGVLMKMMGSNLHLTHEYAKLVQSLSIAAADVSASGCKSGNERAQAIHGRVAILDSVENLSIDLQQQKAEEAIVEGGREALITKRLEAIREAVSQTLDCGLAKDLGGDSNSSTIQRDERKGIIHAVSRLKKAVDTLYNEAGLQGSATLVSLDDQAGPSKVEAKPWYFMSGLKAFFSRNYAEESTLTLLHQRHASVMQSHKGFSKTMEHVLQGQPLSLWQRMTQSVGKVGAILCILLVLPLLWMIGWNTVENKERKRAMESKLNGHEREAETSAGSYTKMREVSSSPSSSQSRLSGEFSAVLSAGDDHHEYDPLLRKRGDRSERANNGSAHVPSI